MFAGLGVNVFVCFVYDVSCGVAWFVCLYFCMFLSFVRVCCFKYVFVFCVAYCVMLHGLVCVCCVVFVCLFCVCVFVCDVLRDGVWSFLVLFGVCVFVCGSFV